MKQGFLHKLHQGCFLFTEPNPVDLLLQGLTCCPDLEDVADEALLDRDVAHAPSVGLQGLEGYRLEIAQVVGPKPAAEPVVGLPKGLFGLGKHLVGSLE